MGGSEYRKVLSHAKISGLQYPFEGSEARGFLAAHAGVIAHNSMATIWLLNCQPFKIYINKGKENF